MRDPGFDLPVVPPPSRDNCCWLFSNGPANDEAIAKLIEETKPGHDTWIVWPLWSRKRPRKMVV